MRYLMVPVIFENFKTWHSATLVYLVFRPEWSVLYLFSFFLFTRFLVLPSNPFHEILFSYFSRLCSLWFPWVWSASSHEFTGIRRFVSIWRTGVPARTAKVEHLSSACVVPTTLSPAHLRTARCPFPPKLLDWHQRMMSFRQIQATGLFLVKTPSLWSSVMCELGYSPE